MLIHVHVMFLVPSPDQYEGTLEMPHFAPYGSLSTLHNSIGRKEKYNYNHSHMYKTVPQIVWMQRDQQKGDDWTL